MGRRFVDMRTIQNRMNAKDARIAREMKHRTFFKSDLPSRVESKLAQKAEAESTWRAVCKAVDARDKRACRACGKKTDPDAVGLLRGHRHHIVYRSAGGRDESRNIVTLCPSCHNDVHKRVLDIDGDADEALAFWKHNDDTGQYLWRREIAVGLFHKD